MNHLFLNAVQSCIILYVDFMWYVKITILMVGIYVYARFNVELICFFFLILLQDVSLIDQEYKNCNTIMTMFASVKLYVE